jgi:hypothetical protein
MLQDGAELYDPMHSYVEADHAMEVQDEYLVEVAFDEPEFGPIQTAPIDKIVYGLPPLVRAGDKGSHFCRCKTEPVIQ